MYVMYVKYVIYVMYVMYVMYVKYVMYVMYVMYFKIYKCIPKMTHQPGLLYKPFITNMTGVTMFNMKVGLQSQMMLKVQVTILAGKHKLNVILINSCQVGIYELEVVKLTKQIFMIFQIS